MLADQRMEKAARLDHDHLWHPFTQRRDWVAEDPLMIERGRGDRADRRRGPPLPRRRLLALVQRPRAPAPGRSTPRSASSSTGSPTRRCWGSPTPAAELAAGSSRSPPPASTASSTRTPGRRPSRSPSRWPSSTGSSAAASTSGRRRSSASRGPTTGTRSARSPSAGSPLPRDLRAAALRGRIGPKPGDIDDMARLLAVREEEVAAVVVEPLVQGAAGMLAHPPGLPARRPAALRPPRRAADLRRGRRRASAAPGRCSPASRRGSRPTCSASPRG